MTTSPIRFSVVIPCYNAADWIEAAIRSVHNQGRDDVEVVVVDDGSSDDSVAVLRRLGDLIRWESGPNKGACAARNRGIAMARGEYVLFLDADDYFEPGFLDELASEIENDVDLVVGGHVVEDAGGARVAARRWPAAKSQADLMVLNLAEPLQTGALLWRIAFVRQHGGWDESLPIAQDTEFALRMLSFKPRFRIVTEGSRNVVWRNVGGDARITTRMTDAKLKAFVDVLLRHSAMLQDYRDDRVTHSLAGRLFTVARIAYAYGNEEVGRLAESTACRLGVKRPPEHGIQAALTRILGFRRKVLVLTAVYMVWHRRNPAVRPYPYNLRPMQHR